MTDNRRGRDGTHSKADARERLSIGRRTMDKAVKAGEIPSLKLGGQTRIPVAAVDRLLDRGNDGAKEK